MATNSYNSKKAAGVKRYKNYEKDFTKKGDFDFETSENEICLMLQTWPGWYDGLKWVSTGSTDEDRYMIYIYYYSKYQLRIVIDAQGVDLDADTKRSYDFVKKAAKKFFLVNTYFKTQPIKKDLSWQYIDEVITELYEDTNDVHSWQKIMTLAQAKKLFQYLKIEIEFPS